MFVILMMLAKQIILKSWFVCIQKYGTLLQIKTKHKKLIVACKNINIDHWFCMLAVFFQLFTWCCAEEGRPQFEFFPANVKMHNYCSFVYKMSIGQHKSVFLLLKRFITSLKLLRKKSLIIDILSHNWPF